MKLKGTKHRHVIQYKTITPRFVVDLYKNVYAP